MSSQLQGLRNVSKASYEESGSLVSLKEFCDKDIFPSVLKVDDGQAALSQNFSFGSDQGDVRIGPVTIPVGPDRLFVALDKKLADVAVCKDLASKRSYFVPIDCSSIEVVPMRPPDVPGSGRSLSLQQIIDCNSLPKIICTRNTLNASKGGSIPVCSLLFPHKLKKGKKKSILMAKREDGTPINISTDCPGMFSVDASDTRVSLAVAAKCAKLPLPCNVRVLDDESSQPLRVSVEYVRPGHVITAVMKMTEGYISDEVACKQQEYAIPVELDFKVTYMVSDRDEVERCVDPPSINNQPLSPKGKPNAISSKARQRSLPAKPVAKSKKMFRKKSKNSLSTADAKAVPQQEIYNDDEHAYSCIDSDQDFTYDSAEDDILYDSADSRSGSYVSFDSDSELSDDIYDVAGIRDSIYVDDGFDLEEMGGNIIELKSLDCKTVQNLLGALNLGRYVPLFQQAVIDGQKLSELSERKMLELGIQIPFHRTRLMRIVGGQVCIKRTLRDSLTQCDSNTYENVDLPQSERRALNPATESSVDTEGLLELMEEIYDVPNDENPTELLVEGTNKTVQRSTDSSENGMPNIYPSVSMSNFENLTTTYTATADSHCIYDVPPDSVNDRPDITVNVAARPEPGSSECGVQSKTVQSGPHSSEEHYVNISSLISKFDTFGGTR